MLTRSRSFVSLIARESREGIPTNTQQQHTISTLEEEEDDICRYCLSHTAPLTTSSRSRPSLTRFRSFSLSNSLAKLFFSSATSSTKACRTARMKRYKFRDELSAERSGERTVEGRKEGGVMAETVCARGRAKG